MKKKLLLILLAIVSTVCMAVTLVSCGGINNFKISFMVDDAVYATIETTGNEAITIPDNPTKDGYTFDGWYWDNNVWSKPFTAKSLLDTPISSDMKVYAKFDENGYRPALTFNSFTVDDDSAYGKVSNATETFSFKNEITTDSQATYGVYTNISCSQDSIIPSKVVSLNVGDNTFYVLAQRGNEQLFFTVTIRRRPKYTVSFNTLGGSSIQSQIIEEDSFATLPIEPTKTGYTFQGWNYDFANTPIVNTTTITANPWTANTYTVKFDGNGVENPEQKTVTYDGKYGALSTLTREGYTFNGWFTAKSGGTKVTANTIVKTAYDQTLYAQWTINQYTVTANVSNADAGSVTGAGTYTYATEQTVTATTNTGYTWLGWYDGDTKLTDELSYTFAMPAENVAYTAKWIACPLTVVANNTSAGSVSKPSTTVLGKNATVTATTKAGYTFIGWYDGDTKLTDELSYTFTMTAKNVTYTAKWSKVTLSKSSSSAGTVSGLSSTYKVGDSATVTATTNLGYTFIGWYDGDNKLTDELSYTFTMTDQSITYTAKWELDKALSLFNFTSTTTTCTITRIKDKTVTSIVVPDYVTSISQGAFAGCGSLESITLPFVGSSKTATSASSSTQFGYIFGTSSYEGGTATNQSYYSSSASSYIGATYYIPSNLKTVTITGGNILSGAFYYCRKLMSITIPNSVTSIGEDAFYGCSSLQTVTFGENSQLISIGSDAFRYCSSLKSINIPDKVTSIGGYAFYDCGSLTSITIPDKVTSIGREAFSVCSSLTSITIPDKVTSIGIWAFSDCSSLQTVTYTGTIDKWAMIEFGGSSANPVYYAEHLYINGVDIYQQTSIVLTSATKISSYAFYKFENLTSITIPDSVTSIGQYSFYYCDKLQTVTFGNNSQLTSIGNWAFEDCYSLKSITIPNSVTSIGSSAFSGCNKLIQIENGVSYVDRWIIDCNTSASSVSLRANTVGIGSSAFSVCSSLTSITIPDSVTSIGVEAFANCYKLTSITIPASVTSIGYWAFNGCSSLTSITISDSVTSIGWRAFYNCSNLTTVYYGGSSTQWENIGIGSYNTPLTSAKRYYYSANEPELNIAGTAYDGNYWHYGDDGVTPVIWVKES